MQQWSCRWRLSEAPNRWTKLTAPKRARAEAPEQLCLLVRPRRTGQVPGGRPGAQGFKQRIRQLTRRSGGRNLSAIAVGLEDLADIAADLTLGLDRE